MSQKLIKKCQYGTPRGGLVPHQESGSWGDRGQGNELQSALENGLSGMWNGVKWVGDKIFNAGDYIENGLIHLTGLIPGGVYTADEMLENKRLSEEAGEGGTYYDVHGNLQINPVMLKAPTIPTLPNGAPATAVALHNRLKKLAASWNSGEIYWNRVGKTGFETLSKTAKAFKHTLKEYEEAIKPFTHYFNKAKDDVKNLYGKDKVVFTAAKVIAKDMRSANRGRPVRKKYLREIEDMLYKDQSPVAKKMYEQLRLKREKISDSEALKLAEEKIFKEYATRRNLTHHLNKLGWIE